MAIFEAVRHALSDLTAPTDHPTLIAGVSGGADSLALMHILARLRHTLGFRVHVATLDHGWRGGQSAADAQYVQAQAQALGLPVSLKHHSPKPNTSSLEAAGRRARYDFFAEIAATQPDPLIVTAHHADDQAETVLLQIIRGAGVPHGMGWRVPLPYHPQFTLIRPLLAVNRAQIEAYCAEHDLVPRHDPTNDDLNFRRNRVRHELLPMLQMYNPAIHRALNQMADIARVENDLLYNQTHTLTELHAQATETGWRFPRGVFQQQHPALQRRVIRHLAGLITPDAAHTLDYTHLTDAVRIAHTGETGAAALFNGGGRLRVGSDHLYFEPPNAAPPRPTIWIDPDHRVILTLDQPLVLPAGTLHFTSILHEQIALHDKTILLGRLHLSPDTQLMVRTRRTGDRIAPAGMEGSTQKLNRWFTNRKLAASQRDRVPLVFAGDRLVAVIHPEIGIVAHPYHRPQATTQPYWIQWTMRS